MGMRAASGAISEVELVNDNGERRLDCRVLGNVSPAASAAVAWWMLSPAGCIWAVCWPQWPLGQRRRRSACLQAPVVLTQTDIRQLQLRKVRFRRVFASCLPNWAPPLRTFRGSTWPACLATTSTAPAQRIGLLPFPPELVQPAGNTALLGVKMALFAGDDLEQYAAIWRLTCHIPLNEIPSLWMFMSMNGFPEG